tara:strand:- start:17 stop:232 length:216 start_codon:yes stop_codon:yes gene_type:complete
MWDMKANSFNDAGKRAQWLQENPKPPAPVGAHQEVPGQVLSDVFDDLFSFGGMNHEVVPFLALAVLEGSLF